eukprot:1529038-Rhodomonas_salina.1
MLFVPQTPRRSCRLLQQEFELEGSASSASSKVALALLLGHDRDAAAGDAAAMESLVSALSLSSQVQTR